MKIVGIRDRLIPISRYEDTDLTTSVVAVETDIIRGGRPVTGYGYASVGRFGQSGLIRERFAPRLLKARPDMMVGDDGNLDPFATWKIMMAGEKAGGHGERCVAVGALDMAIWDAASKIAAFRSSSILQNASVGTFLPRPASVSMLQAAIFTQGTTYPDYPMKSAASSISAINRSR